MSRHEFSCCLVHNDRAEQQHLQLAAPRDHVPEVQSNERLPIICCFALRARARHGTVATCLHVRRWTVAHAPQSNYIPRQSPCYETFEQYVRTYVPFLNFKRLGRLGSLKLEYATCAPDSELAHPLVEPMATVQNLEKLTRLLTALESDSSLEAAVATERLNALILTTQQVCI